MNKRLRLTVAVAALLAGGCGIFRPETRCETHADYPQGEVAETLEMPEGLDPPETQNALPVPEGTRQAVVRDETGRCLERPPRYFGSREPGEPDTTSATEADTAAAAGVSSAVEQDVAGFLEQWAEAWSRRDADAWFTFYADSLAPPGYDDHEDWRASQRERFELDAQTGVDPDTIRVEALDEGRLRVTFEQRFGTEPDLRAVIKQVELDAGGLRGWEIADEQILDVL